MAENRLIQPSETLVGPESRKNDRDRAKVAHDSVLLPQTRLKDLLMCRVVQMSNYLGKTGSDRHVSGVKRRLS